MNFRIIFPVILIIFSFLYSSCTKNISIFPSKYKTGNEEIKIKKPDHELTQRVKKVLKKVEKLADKLSLDSLGQATMSESVVIMDMSRDISYVLVEEIRFAKNWKYKFWLVDILGYTGNRDSVLPLVEVVEEEKNPEKVRLKALESILELGFPEAVEHLLIASRLVKDKKIVDQIEKTIERIR